MIPESDLYHGAALARLCRGKTDLALSIKQHKGMRACYVVDENVALYLKYSTKRLSPWPFTFSVENQSEVVGLNREFKAVFVALICGFDGIVCLDFDEYQRSLNQDHEPGEWIRISRKVREKYTVTGSDLARAFKVGDNEFPSKILDFDRGE